MLIGWLGLRNIEPKFPTRVCTFFWICCDNLREESRSLLFDISNTRCTTVKMSADNGTSATEQENSRNVIGISFGNSYSSIAYTNAADGKAEVIGTLRHFPQAALYCLLTICNSRSRWRSSNPNCSLIRRRRRVSRCTGKGPDCAKPTKHHRLFQRFPRKVLQRDRPISEPLQRTPNRARWRKDSSIPGAREGSRRG